MAASEYYTLLEEAHSPNAAPASEYDALLAPESGSSEYDAPFEDEAPGGAVAPEPVVAPLATAAVQQADAEGFFDNLPAPKENLSQYLQQANPNALSPSVISAESAGDSMLSDLEVWKAALGGAAAGTADIVGGGAGLIGEHLAGTTPRDLEKWNNRILEISQKPSAFDDYTEEQLKQMQAMPAGYRTPQEEVELISLQDLTKTVRTREAGNIRAAQPFRDFQQVATLAAKESQTFFGQDPARQDEFLNKLAAGAGSLPPYIASAMIGGPALSMITGSLQSAQSERNAAIEAGHPEKADEAFDNGLLIGLTEGVGVGGGMSAPAKAFAGKVLRMVKKGVAEGGQEWVQNTLSNLNASAGAEYDPSRPVLKGSGEAALIGFILGGTVEGTGQLRQGAKQPIVAELEAVGANLSAAALEETIETPAPTTSQPPIAPESVVEPKLSEPSPEKAGGAPPASAGEPPVVPAKGGEAVTPAGPDAANRYAERTAKIEEEGRRATPEERAAAEKEKVEFRNELSEGDTVVVEAGTVDANGQQTTKTVRYKVEVEDGRLVAVPERGAILGLEADSGIHFFNEVRARVEGGMTVRRRVTVEKKAPASPQAAPPAPKSTSLASTAPAVEQPTPIAKPAAAAEIPLVTRGENAITQTPPEKAFQNVPTRDASKPEKMTPGGYKKRGLPSAIEMRKEGGSLEGYDDQSKREWLGGSTPPKDGRLKLYRATPTGEEIGPGDYVTNSKAYAQEHIRANLGGEGKITEISATLDDIFPADGPKEFWYAPKSIEPTPAPGAKLGPGAAQAEAAPGWKQAAIPKQLRTDNKVAGILAGEESGPQMRRGEKGEAGAILGTGGTRTTVIPKGSTPKGDSEFIRIPGALARVGRGLFTEGAADVVAKSRNKVGKVLSESMRRHVDLEQEIHGQLTAEFDRAMTGMSKPRAQKAMDEIEPYLAAKENGRATPALSADAQKILTAWENVAEQTGLLAEAHDVQVFDANTGGHRPMHRMGRAYVPRMFKQEVQRVMQDPKSNPQLFNDLVADLAAQKGIPEADAANMLRGEAGRFQAGDFMGNLEMARTGQFPESFYDYKLQNLASRFVPSFAERMGQIIAYGQRLGPRDAPLRKNLWDVARSEAEDSYSQQWLRDAEDQAVNLRTTSGASDAARKAQTATTGLLLSAPGTSVIRNTLSGLASTVELLGVRRSIAPIAKAATDAQSKMDAREVGAVRDDLGQAMHADQLADSKWDELLREGTTALLKYSGYTGSEGFVRTHAALTSMQFARDGVAAIAKNPSSRAAKEALALFKRTGSDAEQIVAEGADWKTGPETRKFVRTVIREFQGGYKFDQVPLWAGSPVGRFFYQFGRWGTQRSRNIWRNGIKPFIGEEVEWHGKKMTRHDPKPLLKMALGSVVLGETFALVSSALFDRDRTDASLAEIAETFSEDEKQGLMLAGERVINDIIMSGTLGVWGQPVDIAKSLKAQSRFKNPLDPPGLASTKALGEIGWKALDQGEITRRDVTTFVGKVVPGAKQVSDWARNVFDEPLYEAENDVRTLRNSARRWAVGAKLDVPKRSGFDASRKSPNAPTYERIQEALLVGDADSARFAADKFIAGQVDAKKARQAVKTSVKGRQPFRVGPFTAEEHRSDFMAWAKSKLSKEDFEQTHRVQERYEAAARKAELW